jgi:hypothetical protein
MRCCSVLALVLVVAPAHARADDPQPETSSDTGSAASSVPAPEAYQPATPAPTPDAPPEDHKVAAAATVAGMYTAFAGWMYLAWYRQHKPLSQYKWGGDDEVCSHTLSRCGLLGWAGDTTYAGGEDKFGHAWSTMSLARLGTEILNQWGGYDRDRSMLVATGLAELLFVGVEVRDGFFFEFSFSDLGGDTVGALTALALMHWPRLDEMFDFRVQYWPSSAYLKKLDGSSACPAGGCSRWNIAEDYSGQTYLLAFHLSSIHALRDMEYGTWSRFVDVTLGYDTRNYKPPPDPTDMVKPTQQMFIGVSLNAQGILDYLLEGHTSEAARKGRKVTHGLFEVFNLPFTSLPLLEHDHSPTGAVMGGGA